MCPMYNVVVFIDFCSLHDSFGSLFYTSFVLVYLTHGMTVIRRLKIPINFWLTLDLIHYWPFSKRNIL